MRPFRRLVLLACAVTLALSLSALHVATGADRDDPIAKGERSPAMAPDDPDMRRADERQREAREKRGSAKEKAERRETRTKHRDMGRADALALAREEFPRLMKGRLFDGAEPSPGLEVTNHLGRGRAVVRDAKTGRRFVAQSSLPLRASTPGGGTAPVDLTLERSGDAIEPVHSHGPVRIDAQSVADVELVGKGVEIGIGGGEQRSAQVAGNRAFFANTHTDTDSFVLPTPTGAEIGLQVRSYESPEEFELDVDLSGGAVLRRARTDEPLPNDPPRSLEIVRDGKPVAYIHPPLAHDADGHGVPSELVLEDGRALLRVEHKAADVRYPLAVDPEVTVYGDYNNSWQGWVWGQVRYTGSDGSQPGYFGSAKNRCEYYCGLYQSHPTNTYITNGSHAIWSYRAPVHTFLYRARFGGMAHSPPVIYGAHHTRWMHGMMNGSYSAWEGNVNYVNQSGAWGPNPFGPADHAAWGVDHDFCFNTRCDRWQGSEQNYALFILQTQNAWGCCGVQTWGEKGTNTMAWATMYLGDRRAPWLTSGLPGDRDWRDDGGGTTRIQPGAHDDGLGLYGIGVSGAASGGGTKYTNCASYATACDKDWSAPFDLRLNEGANRLSVNAHDIVGNYTGTHSWWDRIDRTGPTVSLGGDLAGAGGRSLWRDQHTLTVNATDGVRGGTLSQERSGVQRITISLAPVAVDGSAGAYVQKDAVEQTQAGHSVPLDRTYTLRTRDLVEGRYRLRVTATDRLGHDSNRYVDFTAGALGGDLPHFTFVPFQSLAGAADARVNVANGNALLNARDAEIDDGGLDFGLVRSYNSALSTTAGSLGLGWSLSLGPDVRLQRLGDGSIRFHGPGGYAARFTKAGDAWAAPPELHATLTETNGAFRLALLDDERTLTFPSGDAPVSSIVDEGERTIRMTYRSDGTLERVTDDDNRVTLFEVTNRRITGIVLPGGARHTYVYTGDRLTEHTGGGTTTRFEYDGGGQLSRTTVGGAERVAIGYANGKATSLRLVGTDATQTTGLSYSGSQTSVTFPDGTRGTFASDVDLLVVSSAVGAQAPSVSVSGQLPAQSGRLLSSSTRYGMAYSATGSGSSVAELSVMVDESIEAEDQTGCSASGCTASGDYTYDTEEHVGGQDVITVLAEAPNGDTATRSFAVRTPAVVGSADEGPPDHTDEEEVAQAKRFRSSFGFNADDAYVRGVEGDQTNRDRSPEYGVALTAAEYAEMRTRAEVQMAMHTVRTYAEQFPTFAGLWLDQKGGGIVRVGFTGLDAALRRDELKQRFPWPERLETFTAARTDDELSDLAARVSADFDTLQAEGIEVTNSGTRTSLNNVEIGVVGLDAVERAKLISRYGAGVDPVAATAPEDDAGARRYQYNRRLSAGILVRHQIGDGGRCTAAFSARRERRTRRGRRVFRFFTTTAGHCASGHRPTWIHGNKPVGRTVDSTHFNKDKVDADAQTIGIPRRRLSKVVILDPGYAPRRLSTVEKRFEEEEEGNLVCISGIHNNDCGWLDSRNESVEVNDKKFEFLRTATYESQGGDSGAPIYFPYGNRREARALGLHKGRFGTQLFDSLRKRPHYSHAERIELRFNIRFCVRGRCT